MDLCQRLRMKRREHRLRQEDVAKHLGFKASGKKGSCYWECKSATVNVYNKADQMAKKGKIRN